MKFKRTFLATALCGLALFGMSSAARANTITLTLDTVTPNAVGSFARFTYSALLSGNSELTTGDYFVIYDFNGFAGFDSSFGSAVFAFPGTPGVWNATITAVGPYPTGDGTLAVAGLIRTPGTDSGLLN